MQYSEIYNASSSGTIKNRVKLIFNKMQTQDNNINNLKDILCFTITITSHQYSSVLATAGAAYDSLALQVFASHFSCSPGIFLAVASLKVGAESPGVCLASVGDGK